MTPDNLMKLIDDYACEVADTPSSPTPIEKKLATERTERARNAVVTELAKPEPTQPVQPECWCTRCDLEVNTFRSHMAICPLCGDKRCPRAKDHRDDCTKKSTYDQTALELREICGWKTLIPGEGCLNCQRKAVQPAWHDAPNAPGDWVIVGKGFKSELQTGITQQEIDRVSSWPGRWFGPLPEDTK